MTIHHHHHGMPLAEDPPRRINPTAEEAAKGIIAVKVTVGYCRQTDCRRRFYFVSNIYSDGRHSPAKRLKDKSEIGAMTTRLQLAKESNTVRGSVYDIRSGIYIFKESIPVY